MEQGAGIFPAIRRAGGFGLQLHGRHAPVANPADAADAAGGQDGRAAQGLHRPRKAPVHPAAVHGRRHRPLAPGFRCQARGRQALCLRCLGQQPARGILGRGVPAQRPHAAEHGRGHRRRRKDQGAPALRHRAMDGGLVAEQLARLQCGGAEKSHRDEGREHCQGHPEPAARRQAGPPEHDRRERLRSGAQRGDHRGRGGVRERAVPAARIQAAHGQGVRAAIPAGAAVHQQVLHPRPAAREFADPPMPTSRATASSW
ncbi:hypothetical protein ABID97_002471 [Variovorax sp. OAS795]